MKLPFSIHRLALFLCLASTLALAAPPPGQYEPSAPIENPKNKLESGSAAKQRAVEAEAAQRKAQDEAQKKRDADATRAAQQQRANDAARQRDQARILQLEQEKAALERKRIAELAEATRLADIEIERRVKAAAAAPQQQQQADQARAAATAANTKPPNAIARIREGSIWLAAKERYHLPLGVGTKQFTPVMVVIAPPANGFLMGSRYYERMRDENDEKQHRVSFNWVYSLSETEVTFAQWDACVADGGCDKYAPNKRFGGGAHPVIHVSWHDANTYAKWLNQKAGIAETSPHRFRLPTEAEWEWAARTGNTEPFGFGKAANGAEINLSPNLANYNHRLTYDGSESRSTDPQRTLPVDRTEHIHTNTFGLKDMHGNVWEWVADCYEPDYRKVKNDGTAHQVNNSSCAYRVLRGGSWSSNPSNLRSAFRFRITPGSRDNNDAGFRLARTLPAGS